MERQTQDITEDAEGRDKRSDQGEQAVLEDFLEEVAWSGARVVDTPCQLTLLGASLCQACADVGNDTGVVDGAGAWGMSLSIWASHFLSVVFYFFIHKRQGQTTANERLRSPGGTGSPVSCGSWRAWLGNPEGRAGGMWVGMQARQAGGPLTPAAVLLGGDTSSAEFLPPREGEQTPDAEEPGLEACDGLAPAVSREEAHLTHLWLSIKTG